MPGSQDLADRDAAGWDRGADRERAFSALRAAPLALAMLVLTAGCTEVQDLSAPRWSNGSALDRWGAPERAAIPAPRQAPSKADRHRGYDELD